MSCTTCAAPLASIDAITSAMRSYRAEFSFSVFCGATFTKSTCLRGFTSSATLSTITTNRSSRSDTPSHWAHSGNAESEPRSLRICLSLFSGGGRGASAGLAGSEGAWATAGGSSGVRRRYQMAAAAIATARTASGTQGERFFSMIPKHSHIRENFGSGFNAPSGHRNQAHESAERSGNGGYRPERGTPQRRSSGERHQRVCGQRILQPSGAQPFVVPAQRRTEIERQIVRQRFHQDARSREREGEPLPGDGVDVSGGVPDEGEPLRPPRARSLQQGSGPAQVGVDACAGEPLAQSGKRSQQIVEIPRAIAIVQQDRKSVV